MIKAIIRKWEGCFYLFPAVLFMLALIGYPLIYNIILSFQNVSLANIASKDISFIGIDNYQRLAQDKVFWASLKTRCSTRLEASFFSLQSAFCSLCFSA